GRSDRRGVVARSRAAPTADASLAAKRRCASGIVAWWKNRKVSNCKAWGRCAPAKCDAWRAAAKASIINPVAWRSRVRGYEWESLLLVGASGIPQVVAMRWWERRKGVPGQQRQQQESLL